MFNVSKITDDSMTYVCDTNLQYLLPELESETMLFITWFDANYMKLNATKCHFLFAGNTENLWVNVGHEQLWESNH